MDELIAAISKARSVFALTGAGMSAESGLPTFRGVNGYWGEHRVEDLASPEGFAKNPRMVWRWYNERIRAYAGAQPNAGHYALAQLEPIVERVAIATQNVDSLHIRAGSRNVLELHGDLREARCNRCGARTSIDSGFDEEHLQHGCGGLFRPNVVWFGEMLPQDVWERAAQEAAAADVMLVVGTSAQVYPAAGLATLNPDAFVAEINPDETGLSDRCHCTIRSRAAVVLPKIVAALR